jgi:hypothetical protein
MTYFFPSGNLLSIKLKRTYLCSMLSVIFPLKGHRNEIDFSIFSVYRFGTGPLHNCYSLFRFSFLKSETFERLCKGAVPNRFIQKN